MSEMTKGEMTGRDKTLWAAGYFDSRGGIYQSRTQVKVVITDRDHEVLTTFAAVIGAGWINPRRKGPTVTNRLEFSSMSDVYRVLTMLRPYITSSRLAGQMDRALLWLEGKCPGLAADDAARLRAEEEKIPA